MLDRLISGAGAVTDGADRSVRAAGAAARAAASATTRPGSVARRRGLLVVAGRAPVVAGLEATDPSTPADARRPAEVARVGGRSATGPTRRSTASLLDDLRRDLQRRQRATGSRTPTSTASPGIYWLVDPRRPARRDRPLDAAAGGDLHVRRVAGSSSTTPSYRRARTPSCFDDEVEPRRAHDRPGDRHRRDRRRSGDDRAARPRPDRCPADGHAGRGRAARGLGVVSSRSARHDPTATGAATTTSSDRVEVARLRPGVPARDPGPRPTSRPSSRDATLTGLLRREERAVDDAQTTDGPRLRRRSTSTSRTAYVLDDGVPPGERAARVRARRWCSSALAGVILVGLAGGYLDLPARPARRCRRRRRRSAPGERDPAPGHRHGPDADRSRARPRGAGRPRPVRARAPGRDARRTSRRDPATRAPPDRRRPTRRRSRRR